MHVGGRSRAQSSAGRWRSTRRRCKARLPLTDLIVNPTPLVLAEEVSSSVGCEVWVKRDDQTHPRYGGNKVRKLAPLLADARARGVTHVLTLGAAGSHHVLATAVHGGAMGLTVEAALAGYDGALVVVSHDQDFLSAIGTTRELELKGRQPQASITP